MTEILQSPLTDALGWALVHFLWQGAAIALLAWVLMRMPRADARFRYRIGVAALAAMVAAPVVTWAVVADLPPVTAIREIGVEDPEGAPRGSLGVAAVVPADQLTSARAPSAARGRINAAAAFVSIWALGVLICSVRLAGGWYLARGLARGVARPVPADLQVMMQTMATRLGVRRAVAVFESSAVVVPVMVGWLKPAIVLPLSALSQLSPAHVEALIAHELAHIRRHDYLVNLLQSAVEALLFYHPAVWWLSRRVRIERELCCDDETVVVCDRLAYASALSAMAAMMQPRLALAATDGPLARRIRRILGGREAATTGSAWLPAVLLVLGVAIAVPSAMLSRTASAEPGEASTTASVSDRTTTDTAQAGDRQVRVSAAGGAVVVEAARNEIDADADAMTVTAGSVRTQDRQTTAQQAEAERLRAIAEDRARQAQRLRELQKAELQKALAEVEKAMEQARERRAESEALTLAAHRTHLEAVERQLRAMQQRVAVGVASREQLAAVEVELARASAALSEQAARQADQQATSVVERARLQADLERMNRELERAAALVERGLMSRDRLVDLEVRIANAERRLLAANVSAAQQRSEQERARAAGQPTNARHLYEILIARQSASEQALRYALDAKQVTVVDTPDQTVEAGDLLQISIAGEPDLPAFYTVRSDGTIKVPLLSAVRVTGQTLAQVREAIERQLAGKPTVAKVDVKLLRVVRR